MTITAKMVKELRERTDCGMMECKKALVEVNGDMDAAVELLRTKGAAKADKKASRIAAEGLVKVAMSQDSKKVIIVEVNSETDFVAKDTNFTNFVDNVADVILNLDVNTVEELGAANYSSKDFTGTVEEARKELVTKIGENIQIRRFDKVIASNDEVVNSYVHGGRIAAIVKISGNDADLCRDVAMHVTATSPIVVNPEDVPADILEKEKDIFKAQAAESGKPENIIEKMIQGRISKFVNEISLVSQAFVKDPDTTVGKLLAKANAKAISFVRYGVGEGIEKEESNFAEEVMSQVKGN